MVTLVMKREGVECSPCMKTHQLRLINRAGREVAVLGGRDLWFAGVREGSETYDMARVMVAAANVRGDARCAINP